MTSPILKPLTPDACQDIEELLPWYANGALDPAEMAVVEQYLAQHPDRRVELEQCRALAELIEAHDATAWQPAPGAFDRLMTDIDRLEAVSVSAPAQAVPSLWRRALEWLRNTPSPVRWTLAVESLALAALVLVVLSPASLPTDPGYETLSNREAPTVAIGRQMRVMFDDQMRIGEQRTLLHSITGHIVAGPTPLGVYTVAVAGGDPSDGALDRAVMALRAHPQVRLVEPLAQ